MIRRISLGIIVCILNVNAKNTPKEITWKENPMRWADDPRDHNLFFDRIISINMDLSSGGKEEHKIIATGVMISQNQILSSYNPFRELVRNKAKRQAIVIGAIEKRWYFEEEMEYNVSYGLVACARQVIPMREIDITSDDWHGNDNKHSPVHDLIVFRLDRNFTLQNNNTQLGAVHTQNIHRQNWRWSLAGPLLTKMAEPDEPLGRNIIIASVGHIDEKHIKDNYYLTTYEYVAEDNVEGNCDEWIPRQWGHFICIRNVNDFVAIASGGVLFESSKLFGIGSFALTKGKKSILVFTDVRPYYSLSNNTCTIKDQV